MNEKQPRKWPVVGNKHNFLNAEEAARAKELFEKYDGIMPPYAELSEDDATLFVAWILGLRPSEARWSVRECRGEKVQLDGTLDLTDIPDDELKNYAGEAAVQDIIREREELRRARKGD